MGELSPAPRPGAVASATTGLLLFSINLLLGLMILLNFLWPPPASPRQSPAAAPTATPTLFIIDGPPIAPPIATSAPQSVATARPTATHVSHASPTATSTRPKPTPTATSTPIIYPTPTPTFRSGSG